MTEVGCQCPSVWALDEGVRAGWIPSITGQLSFSLMGEGVPGCVHATGKVASTERVVVAVQRRVARDLPRPWLWSVWTWASANFVLIGETQETQRRQGEGYVTDEQGVLSGEVYLLQKHKGRRRARRDKIVRLLREAVATHKLHGQIQDLSGWMREVLAEARNEEGTPPVLGLQIPQARFALFRSGEFRIELRADTLPTKFRDEDGEDVEGARVAEYREQFERLIAHHFYYFVRDLAHRHYHHHQNSDSFLPLLAATNADDISWRRETAYALGRAALEARRDNDLLSFRKAEGLVAYAEAFQDGLAQQVRSDAAGRREVSYGGARPYNWPALRASMTARSEEEQWRYSGRIQAFVAMLTAALAVFALWFAIAQVRGAVGFPEVDPNQPRGLLLSVASHLWIQPANSTFVAIIGTWMLFELFGRGFRAFAPAQSVLEQLKRFTYALAASTSGSLKRWAPELSDRIGAYVGSGTAVAAAVVLFDLALALAKRDPGAWLPVEWLRSLSSLVRNLLNLAG